MKNKITKKFRIIIERIFQSAGIFFTVLLFLIAVVYATGFVTWSSGIAPQALPGAGNVKLEFLTGVNGDCYWQGPGYFWGSSQGYICKSGYWMKGAGINPHAPRDWDNIMVYCCEIK